VKLPAEAIAHVGGFSITNTLIASWLTLLVLGGLFYFCTRKMQVIPGRLQALAEVMVEGLLNFVESIAGKAHARLLFPGIATIFLYVITNAYMGLLPVFGTIGFIEHGNGHEAAFVPFLRAANTDINLPLSIALVSFVLVETWGMRVVGFFHYTSEFINLRQLGQGVKQLFQGKLREAPMNLVFASSVFLWLLGNLQSPDPDVEFYISSFRQHDRRRNLGVGLLFSYSHDLYHPLLRVGAFDRADSSTHLQWLDSCLWDGRNLFGTRGIRASVN